MKKQILFILISFIIGIMCGRFFTNSSTIETHIISQQTTVQSQTQSDYIATHYTSKTEKLYAPDGHITQEIVFNSRDNKQSSSKTTEHIHTDIVKEDKIITKQNNWILGYQIDPLNYKNWQESELTVSYRIIGNIYSTASTSATFSQIKVGISVSF